MRFPCTIRPLSGGRWAIDCQSADVGHVSTTGTTRAEAIEKMRGELRYRLELCPCTGESYRHIEVEVVEQPSK